MAFIIFFAIFSIFTFIIALYLKRLSKDYYLWAPCKRLKTVDGSRLSEKVYVVPGTTVFGNNFDILGSTPGECAQEREEGRAIEKNEKIIKKFFFPISETIFLWCRELYRRTNGKSYILNFFRVSVYSITSPEDVQEVFQSQTLITKGVIYELARPFLGDGLLVSSGKWRKVGIAKQCFEIHIYIHTHTIQNLMRRFFELLSIVFLTLGVLFVSFLTIVNVARTRSSRK